MRTIAWASLTMRSILSSDWWRPLYCNDPNGSSFELYHSWNVNFRIMISSTSGVRIYRAIESPTTSISSYKNSIQQTHKLTSRDTIQHILQHPINSTNRLPAPLYYFSSCSSKFSPFSLSPLPQFMPHASVADNLAKLRTWTLSWTQSAPAFPDRS